MLLLSLTQPLRGDGVTVQVSDRDSVTLVPGLSLSLRPGGGFQVAQAVGEKSELGVYGLISRLLSEYSPRLPVL